MFGKLRAWAVRRTIGAILALVLMLPVWFGWAGTAQAWVNIRNDNVSWNVNVPAYLQYDYGSIHYPYTWNLSGTSGSFGTSTWGDIINSPITVYFAPELNIPGGYTNFPISSYMTITGTGHYSDGSQASFAYNYNGYVWYATASPSPLPQESIQIAQYNGSSPLSWWSIAYTGNFTSTGTYTTLTITSNMWCSYVEANNSADEQTAQAAESAAQAAQSAANSAATNAQNAYNSANAANTNAQNAANNTWYNGQSAGYWSDQAVNSANGAYNQAVSATNAANGAYNEAVTAANAANGANSSAQQAVNNTQTNGQSAAYWAYQAASKANPLAIAVTGYGGANATTPGSRTINLQVITTGGTAPYQWSVVSGGSGSGTLPAGGEITVAGLTAGMNQTTVKVTDANGQTANGTVSVWGL